jgi:hypothetical protein
MTSRRRWRLLWTVFLANAYLPRVSYELNLSDEKGHKHLLATLLILEFIVLILYLYLYYYLNFYNFELYFRIIFLTFSVCGGGT